MVLLAFWCILSLGIVLITRSPQNHDFSLYMHFSPIYTTHLTLVEGFYVSLAHFSPLRNPYLPNIDSISLWQQPIFPHFLGAKFKSNHWIHSYTNLTSFILYHKITIKRHNTLAQHIEIATNFIPLLVLRFFAKSTLVFSRHILSLRTRFGF